MSDGERLVSGSERRARVAAVFDRVAGVYDQVGVPWFGPIATRLVAGLEPRPGERALDLGCGRGAALFELAAAVGPAGRATGVDLAGRMVAACAAEAAGRGLRHVDARVMDVTAPGLPAFEYDCATASFVIFLLPAPAAALRAWRELLRPGGRLGLSTFADHGRGWLEPVFAPFLPSSGFAASSPFDTDEGLEQLVRGAGYEQVHTELFELDVVFRDLDHWQEWSFSHGQRATWERIPAAEHPRVRAAAGAYLEPHRQAGGGYRVSEQIRLTYARRPR